MSIHGSRWRGSDRAPSCEAESVDVYTDDGVTLRADVTLPGGEGGAPSVGTMVLAHAAFARRSEFSRKGGQGLAPFLAGRGWTVVTFDFRGHGDSDLRANAGDSWGYDDLVRRDLPAVTSAARLRFPGGPLVVAGHSLGGHVAVASQATGRIEADGIALFASSIWSPTFDPSPARRFVKRAIFSAIGSIASRRGYFPVRALGLGSDDESRMYMQDLARFDRGGWRSADGADDYATAAARIRVPMLAIASAADRLHCPPACARRFLDLGGGERTFRLVERADDGGPAPGHMDLVTTPRAMREWEFMDRWARGVSSRRGPARGKSSPG